MKNFIAKSQSAQEYECGYSCDNALLLKIDGGLFFITDGRYGLEAKERSKNCEVIEGNDIFSQARRLLRKSGIKTLTIDPLEFTYGDYRAFQNKLTHIHLHTAANFHQKIRSVKKEAEIEKIKTATIENKEAFDRFADFLSKVGLDKTEAELHYAAKGFLEQKGTRKLSFDPIFAIGENAAKPHALPTDKRLKIGSTVLFDAGTKYESYCSDRTRTALFHESGIAFGTEQRFSDSTQQTIYDLALKAHDTAIESARAGMKAAELDLIARKVIENGGYGEFFTHSLGHGVGLDIHEEPFINKRNNLTLQNGMVFTIEPGIYIPNEFGVRIEDIVVLKNNRAEIL
ncbi:MAG: aminopeptidase P family protein [Helicobacteraceae bacterium]|nr:aminopeptidase P family protein [Helicobacteraceae bacterium]